MNRSGRGLENFVGLMKYWVCMNITLRVAVISILTLSAASSASADLLPIQSYTAANGLIYDSVRLIVEDSRGFLWFCTPIGVSRFDGYRFTSYGAEHGMYYSNIRDLKETNKGVYLFASNVGVYQFDPQSARSSFLNREAASPPQQAPPLFKLLSVSDSPEANSVNRLYKTRPGQILALTNAGVFEADDSRGEITFTRFQIPSLPNPGAEIYELAEDAEGSLWMAHGTGLERRLPDGRFVHYSIKAGSGSGRVTAISIDRQNRLWLIHEAGMVLFQPEPLSALASGELPPVAIKLQIGSRGSAQDDRFHQPPAGAASLFTGNEGAPTQGMLDVYCASDDQVWVGTLGQGLFSYRNRQIRRYTKANGLIDNIISSITEDAFANLWVTSGLGAMKVARKGFVSYKQEDGLGTEVISSLFETVGGELCAIGIRWWINSFDGTRFKAIRPNLPRRLLETSGRVLQDHAGEWWMATPEGLYRFPNVSRVEQLSRAAPKAVYTTKDGLAANHVFGLFEDSRRNIWVSFRGDKNERLVRWDRAAGTFRTFSEADGLPRGSQPEFFCEDISGAVWMSLWNGGLLRYQNERFSKIPLSLDENNNRIHDLYSDSKGRLWIATSLEGLKRLDQVFTDTPHFTTYTIAQGLSSNHIQYLVEDGWGKIYFVTSRGMDRLDPETGQIKYYTAADGLTTAGTGRAFRDRHGALWLGTSRGISRFTPEVDTAVAAPPVFISNVLVAGQPIPLSEIGATQVSNITLEPDQRQLQIDFFGLSLAAGETLRYQYKLEGANGDWSAPTGARTVTYPSISPGYYRFLVRAVTTEETYTTSPASVSFIVLRPVWQRWWFVLAVSVSLGFLAYAAYRYRVAKLLELERIRTRIATDLHDDIGASLSRMAILSEVVKQQTGPLNMTTYTMLNEIADSARSLIDSMSDIVWAIDPRKDDLKSVAQRIRQFASDVLESQEIRWTFEFTEGLEKIKLSPDERRQFYLIFKEAIHNVAKHSGCTEAKLRIFLENNRLHGEISDNGRGFAMPDLETSFMGMGGNGLKNMQARAGEVGGQLGIDSAPGKGSHILFVLPLKKLNLGG
jgi:signal transduction histidine kinase/ligand-binding sensor domain-containing protein